ncbi:isatin hydrolase-like [Watersipora subatra]|uniref:isatin hydrolase-like n=1 Tax=Watersipora subatra TaxID=2589382 RepID=UPI00355BAEEB
MAACWILIALCGIEIITVRGKMNYVDLSHSLNSQSHSWPAYKAFELKIVANESLPDGGWYASNDISLNEHTSTHLDAPVHFAMRDGIYYASTIPVERLVGPVSLINLAKKAAVNRDYLVTSSDILEWEETYGQIPKGAIVLFDFNWAQYWDSFEDVFGSDSTNTSTFHFPGVGIDAAKILAQRGVYGVGIDTPSPDSGPVLDHPVHSFLLDKNIYILENVADMSSLPAGGKGVTLVVGAMKIDSGTGGPARLIAMFDDAASSANILSVNLLIILACLFSLSFA